MSQRESGKPAGNQSPKQPDTHTRHLGFYDEFCVQFSRLGPAGLAPKAPGTVGSAVAMAIAPLFFMPLPMFWRMVVLAALFVVASFAVTRAEAILGSHDPGEIVVDELVGQWFTFLPFASLSLPWLIVGFLLFRLFDITKPFPVRSAEKWLPAGWGVMIDDVLAGFYAMFSLGALRLLFA